MFAAARFFTAVIVIWTASLRWPHYNYYMVLRAAVFVVSAWGAYTAFKLKDRAWLWAFGIIALLFNPFWVIHLTRAIWLPINLVTGIALLISLDGKIFAVSPPDMPKESQPADA
jgi:hypothetical protein